MRFASIQCSKMRLREPGPRWGSLQRSPDPLAGFKGPTSKGREGEGTGAGEGGEGRERGEGGQGKGREGEGSPGLSRDRVGNPICI